MDHHHHPTTTATTTTNPSKRWKPTTPESPSSSSSSSSCAATTEQQQQLQQQQQQQHAWMTTSPSFVVPPSCNNSNNNNNNNMILPATTTTTTTTSSSTTTTTTNSICSPPTSASCSLASFLSTSSSSSSAASRKNAGNIGKRSAKALSMLLKLLGLLWTFCTLWIVTEWQNDVVPRLSEEQPDRSKTQQLLLHKNIPLPLPRQKVSVVIMNYGRPRMIRESSLMPTLLKHPNIDEILLLHANAKTSFEYRHPKVVNIDATQHNDRMGLSLRFYFCQLAKHDWVLHVDDDMEFPTGTLSDMLIEFGRNPHRIVGRHGRNLVPANSFAGYSSHNTHKQTEVVLTKLMVMERHVCSSFFQYAHLIWDDVVLNSGEAPMWNGEDIFMSLVANHVYGPNHNNNNNNNFAMDWLPVHPAPNHLKDYDNGKLDISGGMSGLRFWDWQWWQSVLRRNRHYSFRGKLWQTAKQRLEESST